MDDLHKDTAGIEARTESRASAFAMGLSADLAFGVGTLVLSSTLGIAFESSALGIIIGVLGGMFAWAVWKEFQDRVLRRSNENET